MMMMNSHRAGSRMRFGVTIRRTGESVASSSLWRQLEIRGMATAKGPNRAAVHGSKMPVSDVFIDKEEAEREIEKGKEEREKKRKEMEEASDLQINRSRRQEERSVQAHTTRS